MKTETEPAHDLSFPKIPSVWIRAMRQNQRIILRDAYVLHRRLCGKCRLTIAAVHADPNLPRLPAARHGQQHPQRQPGAIARRIGHEVHLFCQDRSAQEPEGVTIHVPDIGRVSFPKIPSGRDSRGEAESGHHLARCSGCSTCLGRSSPTCSSRNVGLKSRTSFSDISSILH
jgi:hypothetical protein